LEAVDHAALGEAPLVLGIEADGLGEIGDGLVEVAELAMRGPARAVGPRVEWVHLDRFIAGLDGLGVLALHAQVLALLEAFACGFQILAKRGRHGVVGDPGASSRRARGPLAWGQRGKRAACPTTEYPQGTLREIGRRLQGIICKMP